MKTSELQGAALDWAVAKCEGKFKSFDFYLHESTSAFMLESGDVSLLYSPATQWKEGGPIIEREGMALHPAGKNWSSDIDRWYQGYGPTPLIAAMRCYVVSKLGDEVEIPEKLK
jgi:hypothetical protein